MHPMELGENLYLDTRDKVVPPERATTELIVKYGQTKKMGGK